MNIHSTNSAATINHRHLEAADCVRDGRHLLRNNSDPITFELFQIEKARQRCQYNGNGQADLSRYDQDLVAALGISESTTSITRCQLEAYLITGLAFEEISKRVSVSARVVQLYEAAFFNVLTHLENQQVLQLEVLPRYANVESQFLIPDFIWKVAALEGVEVLESLMATRTYGCSAQDACSDSISEARIITLHKIAMAARDVDASDQNAIAELRRTLTSLEEIKPDDEPHEVLRELDKLLKALPFRKGEPHSEDMPEELLRYERDSAVELHTDELLRVSFGQTLPEENLLLNLRFLEGDGDPVLTPSATRQGLGARVSVGGGSPCEGTPDRPCESTQPSTALTNGLELQRNQIDYESAMVVGQEDTPHPPSASQGAAPRTAGATTQGRALDPIDSEWEAIAARFPQGGAQLNRAWLKFRKKYPTYVRKESRERRSGIGNM